MTGPHNGNAYDFYYHKANKPIITDSFTFVKMILDEETSLVIDQIRP